MKTLPTIAQTVERRRYALPPGVEPAQDILDDDMPEPMFQHPFFFAIVEILTSFPQPATDETHGRYAP